MSREICIIYPPASRLSSWYRGRSGCEFRASCLSLSALIKSVGQLKFPGSSELCFVNCMCLGPLMHDLNCFVNVNRWESSGFPGRLLQILQDACLASKAGCLSRPRQFFRLVCVGGGSGTARSKNNQPAQPPFYQPMKPSIHTASAPRCFSRDPETNTQHEC